MANLLPQKRQTQLGQWWQRRWWSSSLSLTFSWHRLHLCLFEVCSTVSSVVSWVAKHFFHFRAYAPLMSPSHQQCQWCIIATRHLTRESLLARRTKEPGFFFTNSFFSLLSFLLLQLSLSTLLRAYYVCGKCQQWEIIHKEAVRAKRRNETPWRQTEASFVIICQWLREPPMLPEMMSFESQKVRERLLQLCWCLWCWESAPKNECK